MITDTLDQYWTTSPDAAESKVGDEIVLLHLKSGVYFGLDALGARVWQGLKSGRLPQAICEEIARDFKQEIERVRGDVRTFLGQLTEQTLVAPN